MIDCEDVASTCTDSINSFGASLCTFHKVNGDSTELIMWESYIEAMYCNLWLVKEWQAKQTVTVGDKCYVDHCNCFGNHSLYKVFLSLSSLILKPTWMTMLLLTLLAMYSFTNPITTISLPSKPNFFSFGVS